MDLLINLPIPTISVVMPLYNKRAEVGRAVSSVLNQTVVDFELIIVNDGSTDDGPQVVHRIKDSRIRLINQDNLGVSAARNRGIEVAQAELIAFLDADDEWKPDFLETILRLRNDFPSCDVFATAHYIATPNGRVRSVFFKGMPRNPWEGMVTFYFTSKFDAPISSSAIAVTKKAITAVGGFPVGITVGEDMLTWARLSLKYNFAYSTHPCSIYWAPVSARQDRITQFPDLVGQEMERIIHSGVPSKAFDLRERITYWYRRRGIMNIFLGDTEKAIEEIGKAMGISGMNGDLFLLVVIARVPPKLATFLLRILKGVKALHRNFTFIKGQLTLR